MSRRITGNTTQDRCSDLCLHVISYVTEVMAHVEHIQVILIRAVNSDCIELSSSSPSSYVHQLLYNKPCRIHRISEEFDS